MTTKCDFQFFQSNEVKNANAMEKEGLLRCFTSLSESELQVDTLVTDRHIQIRKHMGENLPEVKHRLDGWHVGKG